MAVRVGTADVDVAGGGPGGGGASSEGAGLPGARQGAVPATMAFSSTFLLFFCGAVAALARAGPAAAGGGAGAALNFPLNVTVDSLADVFDGVFDPGEGFYLRDSPSVHDPSRLVRVVAANGAELLMLAATGKEQADGYECGLETWYLMPEGLVPGQCILQEKPEWALDLVPSNPGAVGFASSLARARRRLTPSGGPRSTGRRASRGPTAPAYTTR